MKTIDKRDWERLEQLFLLAAELDQAERSQFLDAECAGDARMRAEVEAMLAADPESAAAISEVLAEGASGVLADDRVIGTRAGSWKIVREIGRGGMGTVYLAEREDGQFRQTAALKLIRRGMDTVDLLIRFRRERQILATLDHPHIARLIDGGSTSDGRPFLVMEYVEGEAIDAYCDRLSLGIEDRLRLVLKVCEAVSHAHRKLIVHRDLKPTNLLIANEATPKLLDFGLAKILEEDFDSGATQAMAARPFTPDYASPEQVRGEPITTATDIYSLGAILYELLSGAKPHRQPSGLPVVWERTIVDTEPPPPSYACAHAGTRPPRWSRRLEGDLDNIVLMALRKDAARRYASVDQFAEDIRRYLDWRPVIARRDSAPYRALKFLRRERFAVAAAALAVAGLVGGMAVAVSQAQRAEAARRLAEARSAQIVELSNRSLSDVYALLEHLPGAFAARQQLVTTILEYLRSLSAGATPNEEARIAAAKAYLRLGDVQGNPDAPSLRDMSAALKTYREGAAVVDFVAGGSHPNAAHLAAWLDLQQRIGSILTESGDGRGAVSTFERALDAAARSRPAAADRQVERSENSIYLGLARALQLSDPQKALQYANRHFAVAEKLLKTRPEDADALFELSIAHTQVGYILIVMGDLEGAAPHYRESIVLREDLALRHPENVTYRRASMLAYEHYAALQANPLIANLGNIEEARRYYEKARVLEDRAVADSQNQLAKYDYANFLLRSAIIDVPPEMTGASIAALAKAAAMFGEFSAADRGIVRYRRDLATAYEFLGHRRLAAGDPNAALAEYRRAAAINEELTASLPNDRPLLIRSFSVERGIVSALSRIGEHAGAIERARRLVVRAEAGLRGASDKDLWTARLADAHMAVATAHRAAGASAKAREAAAESAGLIRPLASGRPADANTKLLREAEAAAK